jgi:hypothetical protein
VLADAHAMPAGRPRLRWLAGGLSFVVREAHGARRTGYALILAAVAITVPFAAARFEMSTVDGNFLAAAAGALVVAALAIVIWTSRPPGRRLDRGRRALVLATCAAALGCAALVGYGLARYPTVATDSPAVTVAYLTVFAALLVGYAGLALALARTASPAVTHGTTYGVAAGLLGFVALAVANAAPGARLLALPAATLALAALVVPGTLAGLRTISTASASGTDGLRAGAVAGLWSGTVGALTLFLLGVGATFAFPDPIRDAPSNTPLAIRQDAPALAAAGVGDTLAGAVNLLWMLPAAAILLGCVTAAIAQSARPAT